MFGGMFPSNLKDSQDASQSEQEDVRLQHQDTMNLTQEAHTLPNIANDDLFYEDLANEYDENLDKEETNHEHGYICCDKAARGYACYCDNDPFENEINDDEEEFDRHDQYSGIEDIRENYGGCEYYY